MADKLAKAVMNNEYSLTRLFCDEIIDDNFIRFYDNKIRDMYDHNFSDVYSELTPEILAKIKHIREERNEGFININSFFEIPELEILGYEKSVTVTMATEKLAIPPLKVKGVTYKNLKDKPELINDFIALDLKYYGKEYGESFVGRRMYRYFTETLKDTGVNYFGCYINNKLVALCYSYYAYGVVALDGLIVEEEYRHKHIAINLIKHIQDFYQNCPIYLHAEHEGYPESIYLKIGFRTLYQKYGYFLQKEKWA